MNFPSATLMYVFSYKILVCRLYDGNADIFVLEISIFNLTSE